MRITDAVNIHEAKTQFSKLVERAEAGEEVTIARAGRPVARLGPIPASEPRRPGGAEALIVLGEDFDDPLPGELRRAFGQA